MKPELLTEQELEKIKRCLGYEARMIDDGILYDKIVKLNMFVGSLEATSDTNEGDAVESIGADTVAGWGDDDA